MNYYEHHIGDYLKDTAHLSLLEHGVYRRLLDVYYTREGGIPDDQAARLIGARSKEEREALSSVLAEFFILRDGLHVQTRCDREVERFRTKSGKAKSAADARWGRCSTDANASSKHEHSADAPDMRTHAPSMTNAMPRAPVPRHQTPDTISESKIPLGVASKPRPSKKAPEGFILTDEMRQWVADNCPGVNAESETAKFRDHTFGTPRVDWLGTWRNWLRRAHEDLGRRPPQRPSTPDFAGVE